MRNFSITKSDILGALALGIGMTITFLGFYALAAWLTGSGL